MPRENTFMTHTRAEMCPARKNCALQVPQHLTIHNYLEAIEPVERSKFFEKLLILKKWAEESLEKVEEWGLNGGLIPGWVQGNGRSTREWQDPIYTPAVLRQALVDSEKDPELIWEKKLISPAGLEKILGKSKKICEFISKLTIQKEGRPKLVRE